MTDLHEKVSPPTENIYFSLVDEVLHWIAQPKIREDPIVWALASQSWDILEGMSLEENVHLANQVCENLRQL